MLPQANRAHWKEVGRGPLEASKGKKFPKKGIAEAKVDITFKEGKYAFTYNGVKGDRSTFKIEGKAKPATIDWPLTEVTNKGKTQLGIYKLEGDQVTFAFGQLGSD